MADENLRRALMVSQGSFLPVFTRPVSLILFLVIVWTVVSQFPAYRKFKDKLMGKIFRRKSCQADFDLDGPEEG
jgi:putative tricarboxylic transport membrane protein